MAQQTAIEWFVDYLEEHLLAYDMKLNLKQTDAYDMAKVLEKEQIIQAYQEGEYISNRRTTAEQYYNETYGK